MRWCGNRAPAQAQDDAATAGSPAARLAMARLGLVVVLCG